VHRQSISRLNKNQLHSQVPSRYGYARPPARRARGFGRMIVDRVRDVIPAPLPGLDLRREYGHHQSPAIRAGGLIFCSGGVAAWI
jgi:hypothetical protein